MVRRLRGNEGNIKAKSQSRKYVKAIISPVRGDVAACIAVNRSAKVGRSGGEMVPPPPAPSVGRRGQTLLCRTYGCFIGGCRGPTCGSGPSGSGTTPLASGTPVAYPGICLYVYIYAYIIVNHIYICIYGSPPWCLNP